MALPFSRHSDVGLLKVQAGRLVRAGLETQLLQAEALVWE
jgi:hypothetical protein